MLIQRVFLGYFRNMEEEDGANEIPYLLNQKMTGFDESLGEVESILKPFLKIPITDMRDKVKKFWVNIF